MNGAHLAGGLVVNRDLFRSPARSAQSRSGWLFEGQFQEHEVVGSGSGVVGRPVWCSADNDLDCSTLALNSSSALESRSIGTGFDRPTKNCTRRWSLDWVCMQSFAIVV